MFYLYIRIYSRNQLMQLEPAFMGKLIRQIKEISYKYGGVIVEGQETLFRFAALYRDTLVSTIQAAEECLTSLEVNRDLLDGFNIILTKSDKPVYELHKKLEYLVYQLLDDGGIWIDPDCAIELDDHLTMDKESLLYKMTGRKKSEPTSEEQLSVIMGNRKIESRIEKWLDKGEQSVLVLSGEEDSGRRTNLQNSLKGYREKGKLFVIHLKLKGGQDYIYDPFIDCLSRGEYQPENLEESDFLQDLLMGKMMSRCSDFFSDDFEEAFLDFLEKQKQKASSNSGKLFIVIEKGENFSAISKKLLKRILEKEGCRFILLSSDRRPSYLPEQIKSDVILFKPPTRESLKARLVEAFPGVLWTDERLDRLEEVKPYNLKSLFFSSWLMVQKGIEVNEGSPLDFMINSLHEREKRVLQYIYLAKGLVSRREIILFLADEKEDEALVSERIDRLKSLSFVMETKRGELYTELEKLNVNKESEQRIVRDLVRLIRKKGEENPFRYFAFLEEHEEMGEALVYLNNIMNWLINNGFKNRAENLISNPPFSGKELDPEFLDSLQNLLFSNRLRLTQFSQEKKLLNELVTNGLLSQVTERGLFADDFFLQLSRYYCCQGNSEQSVHYAKNALFMFQKKGHHRGESLANIELAFAFLGQRKVQMGMDYFEIARRISYQIEDNYTLITAYTFGALTSFLFGNMSKAENIITQTLELAGRNGCRRRIFFLTFLAGRIRFEYGQYKESAELFEECFRLSELNDLKEGGDTARRWIGRSLLYEDKRRDAFRWLDSEDNTREGLFFLAEADFMVSLYESSLRRLEKAESLPSNTPLSYSERDYWCDGFMPIEGRLSSGDIVEDVLGSQIGSLHSHILALTGRHNEGREIFMKMCNQDDYPFKPYSYKYSYIYFTLLNVGEIVLSGDDNRLVALSRAIERLQSRAGRFDNQHKKLDFLKGNWWNNKIMEEAHRKKFL
jgi:tetratricopeptide (TPR) repeat protein